MCLPTCSDDHKSMFNPSPRPFRELLTALGAFALLFLVLLVGVLAVDEAAIDIDDLRRPDVLLYAMLTIIVMLPACWVAVRWAGRRPFASLVSADCRFRWGVALRPLPLMLVVLLAGNAAFLAFNPHGPVSFDATSMLLLGIIMLTVPLQAAAEELVFRGLLPQIIGGWVQSPWLVYGVPSALFVAGHSYDLKGLIDIAVFAVCMSVLAYRTRGIEIPIVLHMLNNLCAFGLGAIGAQDLNQEVYSWGAVIASSATTILVTLLILSDKKFMEMCAGGEPAEGECAVSERDDDGSQGGERGGEVPGAYVRENAPHQGGKGRVNKARAQTATSARPESQRRDGRRPSPVQA